VEAKLVHCKVCTQFTLTFVEYRRGSFLDRVYTGKLSKIETGLYVNIVYGNVKSDDSQDYAQKPQRDCTFMDSASGNALDFSTKK
jgi:hypothetical protein